MTPGYTPKQNYVHNVHETFDLLDAEDLEKIMEPAFDYAAKTLRAAEAKSADDAPAAVPGQ